MNIRTLRYLTSSCLAILILCHSYSSPEQSVRAAIQGEPAWITLAPPDEEFSASVPAGCTARAYPGGATYNIKTDNTRDEKVLAHREYSGYGNGLIFIIHSFKAERPQKLPGGLLGLIDQSAIFQRLFFDGITADLYQNTVSHRYGTYAKHTLRFVTTKHLYLVTLMTLEEANPAVDRFLSSLRLRTSDDQINPVGPPIESTAANTFSANEVTRRAIVVWKSEPWYTDEARAHKVIGTVTLEAVFGADGYVANITVTRGLKDGLTESAIDAARNIRFFPAEKDGKPVSQRTMLEYTFDLY